jgi:signal transduction histidine kinase
MKRIARLIGLFSILLLFFAVALVMSQRLLLRQTERLRADAIEQKRTELVALLALAEIAPPPWTDQHREQIGHALGARITVVDPGARASTGERPTWSFAHTFGPDEKSPRIEVTLKPPPSARLFDTFQRVATILFNLALAIIVVFAGLLLWSVRTRDTVDEAHAHERDSAQAGFHSLQQLASVSARQSVELERERTSRLRAEEDLNIKQLLLNHALEQKIRLGQDLHDGIIQSLYATGLTLEATRALVATDPAAADERIAGSTRALNTTIREVRAYINGLSPDTLRRQTFGEAVGVLTRDLAAGRGVEFVVSIDEPTAARLDEEATTDLLQVVREAVSNSLRHGAATRVSVRLAAGPGAPQLMIEDNGRGFDTGGPTSSGHGLENMDSRIRRLGGTFHLTSTPGSGTTVHASLSALRPA